MLTSAKVAELLGGVSEWWVREQCKSGALPSFKIAGEWRIDADEFDAWREAQRYERTHVEVKFEPPALAAHPQRGSLGGIVATRRKVA